MSAYDVIVIGAGHNGLTAAATLARAGRSVLVVEARGTVGGLAGAHELHPGFHACVLNDTTGVRRSVVHALELEKHGLRMRAAAPDVLALGNAGESLVLRGDRNAAVREIAARSQKDAQRYGELCDFVERVRPALAAFLDEPPVDVLDIESAGAWELLRRGLRVRKLGRRDMLELMRLPPMCAADWLNEWFELDVLKAALALPAVGLDYTGPWSPGTNARLLFGLCAAGPGVEGGTPALVEALEKATRAAGAEIRTGARVEQIRVDGHVRGVQLSNGETIDAPVVAAACHPAETFLRLMPRRTMPFRLLHRMQRFRSRGTTAVASFALRNRPRFKAHAGTDIDTVRVAASLDDIERSFDAVKYGRIPAQFAFQMHVASASNKNATGGAVPAGADASARPDKPTVLSVLVHYVPPELEGGWSDAACSQLGERVRDTVEACCDSLDVVATEVWSPSSLESEFSLPHGNLNHGEHSLDQILVRPIPECSRYETPIPGLFLCGGGNHPGGGITCAPGSLAAQTIRSRT